MGSLLMSCAIAASEVAITVESMFSMNRATARMSGTRRLPMSLRNGLLLGHRLDMMAGDVGAGVGRQAQEGEAADRGGDRHAEPGGGGVGQAEPQAADPRA